MKKLLSVFVVIFLVGCSSSKYGNYTNFHTNEFNSVLAQNAYTQLSILYPPSTSSFTLSHEFNDEFGINLYEKLKSGGYAVYQPNQPNQNNQNNQNLAYVIDKTENDIDMYRLTLFVDGKHLTKSFLIKNGNVTSVGFWTKQE